MLMWQTATEPRSKLLLRTEDPHRRSVDGQEFSALPSYPSYPVT
jgi:hypothetical protein